MRPTSTTPRSCASTRATNGSRASTRSPESRDGLITLASFDYEIRLAPLRARDPNLAAIRLAWWREVVRGERDDEAVGNPVALALRAAADTFALPTAELEAMVDARLQEIAPQDDFNLVAFEHFADESEGARLRLATLLSAGGREVEGAHADAPAGLAMGLARMLSALPFRAGVRPTLFPVDVAARHGVLVRDFEAKRATPAVIAACAEMRALARDKLGEAERRLKGATREVLPAFVPLGGLRLDLDRLDRRGGRPFRASGEPSPLHRQWAIWRWARAR